ncbi:Polysaccharide deacetylase family protein [Candidatus Bealeia paramacronuclearis]|uniref:Chitooligosaccharide deacetylase n=1 Tax=Candidatus Bealeia paramacronuclearis TaxID=1921001 RepID=A0ABZ2C336_9PROT|nr:Polysaccharide deacetylase family protein [Candidatus Bealeia paramacronuclearis]
MLKSSKRIYLTIDDSPSIHTYEKIDFLKAHTIPAVFFCRGEFIKKYPDQVAYAIQNGFLVGNHSYSHPYFSKISLNHCYNEILKTEELIETAYKMAGTTRLHKVIRLPFGDRGGDNSHKIQKFLKELHFCPMDFGHHSDLEFYDAPWTWDTKDYKKDLIESPESYLKKLEDYAEKSSFPEEILLLHDFDHTHHLFEITMSFLMSRDATFLPLPVSSIQPHHQKGLF